MKKINRTVLSAALLSANLLLNSNNPLKQGKVSFTENKGQVCDQFYRPRPDVLYSGMVNGMTFHLRESGISYQLHKIESWAESELNVPARLRKPEGDRVIRYPDKGSVYRIDVNWLHGNPRAQIIEDEMLAGYSNYILESCPTGVYEVFTYTGVTYKQIYNGIDLHYYESNGGLKYDLICAAGSDYKSIAFEVNGAKSIRTGYTGELIIETPLGDIIEEAPVVFQSSSVLRAYWTITDNFVSFEIEGLDNNKPFIIDPSVRHWATFYGGTDMEYGFSVCPDTNGNVYMVGATSSAASTVIATTGSYQFTYGGAAGTGGPFMLGEAFLVKFNSSGVRLWATYYGGAGYESAFCCKTDAAGNIFVSGASSSTLANVIATPGTHQTICGGHIDGFLAKFNSAGVRLFSTYYGGNGRDMARGCALDQAGNIYIVGMTSSTNGIASPGGFQTTFLLSPEDMFVAKFNSAGVRQWGTYYGNQATDWGMSCATDPSGNIYMAGIIEDNGNLNILATAGAHQTLVAQHLLVKFDPNGSRLWATYYGTVGINYETCCATDPTGNVYLCGSSALAGTMVATPGSFQPYPGGGYLVKFNPAGVRQWGTFYGAAGDGAYGLTTDRCENVYLSGKTGSYPSTSLATTGGFQQTWGLGFLVKFNSSGVRQAGTYFATPITALATDASGYIYAAGNAAGSFTNLASAAAHQTAYAGGQSDAFLAKFSTSLTVNAAANKTLICKGESTTLTATGAQSYSWTPTGSGTLSVVSPTTSTTYTLLGSDGGTCTLQSQIVISVQPCTEIEEGNKLSDLYVFPNPSSGSFYIDSQNSYFYSIHDFLGRSISSGTMVRGKNELVFPNCGGGIYLLQVFAGEYKRSFKLIKE